MKKKILEIKFAVLGLGVILLVGTVLFFVFPEEFFSGEIYFSYAYAAALNVANFFLALVLYSLGMKSNSNSVFMKFAMGGMIIRMFFIIFAIFILIKFLNIQKSGFILIFFIIYFILLIVEIIYYKRKLTEN